MTDEKHLIRGLLSHFTPERPLVAPPSLYQQMLEMPDLADMMDRVRPNMPIPAE